MMRALTGFPLDDDLIDLLLQTLDNFKTLVRFVASCKAVHAVYQRRQHSIVERVTRNQVGSAYDQALALVRLKQGMAEVDDVRDWMKNGAELHESNVTGEMKLEDHEAVEMAKNARAVFGLEDFFSWRHKDNSSPTSRLTWEESRRFQCAIYRYWEMCVLFGFDTSDDVLQLEANEYNDAEDDDAVARIDHRWIQVQEDYLGEFSDKEVHEIATMPTFINETIKWMRTAWKPQDYGSQSDQAHGLGPGSIWTAMDEQDLRIAQLPTAMLLDDGPWANDQLFFFKAYNEITTKRKIKAITEEPTSWANIILNPDRELRHCDSCGGAPGEELWGEQNWSLLRGVVSGEVMREWMPGLLGRNVSELGLTQCMNSPEFSHAAMMREMFADSKEFGDEWKEDGWYCLACLRRFISDHVVSWWVDRRKARGEAVKEDCWYGWNCRTQTHSHHHASRLNHMCVPTRGEGS